MPALRLESHKESCGKGTTYVLGAGILCAAIEPLLRDDMRLELQFTAKQAFWKEQRDQVEESGTYKLLRLSYRGGRDPALPVDPEPQLIAGHVHAIPLRALPPGVAVKPLLSELLIRALAALAPGGLPAIDGNPKYAWLIELELSAPERMLSALLTKPGNTGQWALWQRFDVPASS